MRANCCRIVSKELAHLGLETQYMDLPVSEQLDEQWEGVKTRYWFHRTYRMPIVYWKDDADAAQAPNAE